METTIMKTANNTLATTCAIFILWSAGMASIITSSEVAAKGDQAIVIHIPNARTPLPGVLTGGQPTVKQFVQAKAAGYKTIVNLRTPGERGEWDEAAKAKELGIKYVAIPVNGGAGITLENTNALMQVVTNKSNHPVIIHCASGNRVGALFAFNAAAIEHKSNEEALHIGRKAGLTSLEPIVKQILEKRGK